MSQALDRIKELQAELEKIKRIREDEHREQVRKTGIIRELQENIVNLKKRNERLEKQIQNLEESSRQKDDILRMMENFKEFDNNTIDNLRDELDKAQISIKELRYDKPPTPPATPAPTVCCNCSPDDRDKQTEPKRKKQKFTPKENEKISKIVALKFRSQGPMILIQLEGAEKPKEIHAEDAVAHFKDLVKEFLNSKKNSRKGRQIQTIKEKRIECLLQLLDEDN